MEDKKRKREEREEKRRREEEEEEEEVETEEESDDDDDEEEEEEEEEEEDGEEEESNKEDDDDDDDDKTKEKPSTTPPPPTPINRDTTTCIFLRNLPYDTTRHDIFTLLKPHGKINSIYLCRDKSTHQPKGTAFVYFHSPAAAQTAFLVGGDESHPVGLYVKERRVFVSMAVTKETAKERFNSETKKESNNRVDRRCLYLKDANHLKSNDGVPQSDLDKRVRSKREMLTKLKSPLFFINDVRLSIRNLNKSVDKEGLRRMVTVGLKRGLEAKRATVEDVKINLGARGVDWRKMEEGELEVPEFDEGALNDLIPSVHISMDETQQSKNNNSKRSRGFGFVEFQHHCHALACLRELDNNVRYAKEGYVVGGGQKQKANGGLISRPICEFTVENKVKAKQQAERRLAQQERQQKAREMTKTNDDDNDDDQNQKTKNKKRKDKKQKKMSRGKLQREKRRRLREQQNDDDDDDDDDNDGTATATPKEKNKTTTVSNNKALIKQQQQQQQQTSIGYNRNDNDDDGDTDDDNMPTKKKKKLQKQPKKTKKVDKDEMNFDDMVRSYKKAFMAGQQQQQQQQKTTTTDDAVVVGESKKNVNRRWFE